MGEENKKGVWGLDVGGKEVGDVEKKKGREM